MMEVTEILCFLYILRTVLTSPRLISTGRKASAAFRESMLAYRDGGKSERLSFDNLTHNYCPVPSPTHPLPPGAKHPTFKDLKKRVTFKAREYQNKTKVTIVEIGKPLDLRPGALI